jgi:hypothetical protein
MNAQSAAQALPVVLGTSSAERLAALFDAHHQRLYRLACSAATFKLSKFETLRGGLNHGSPDILATLAEFFAGRNFLALSLTPF